MLPSGLRPRTPGAAAAGPPGSLCVQTPRAAPGWRATGWFPPRASAGAAPCGRLAPASRTGPPAASRAAADTGCGSVGHAGTLPAETGGDQRLFGTTSAWRNFLVRRRNEAARGARPPEVRRPPTAAAAEGGVGAAAPACPRGAARPGHHLLPNTRAGQTCCPCFCAAGERGAAFPFPHECLHVRTMAVQTGVGWPRTAGEPLVGASKVPRPDERPSSQEGRLSREGWPLGVNEGSSGQGTGVCSAGPERSKGSCPHPGKAGRGEQCGRGAGGSVLGSGRRWAGPAPPPPPAVTPHTRWRGGKRMLGGTVTVGASTQP